MAHGETTGQPAHDSARASTSLCPDILELDNGQCTSAHRLAFTHLENVALDFSVCPPSTPFSVPILSHSPLLPERGMSGTVGVGEHRYGHVNAATYRAQPMLMYNTEPRIPAETISAAHGESDNASTYRDAARMLLSTADRSGLTTGG